MRAAAVLVAGVTVMGLPQSAMAATLTTPGPFSNPLPALVRLVLALVLVLGCVVVLVRVVGKRWSVQTRGSIQVLAARQLAPNRSVQVIAIGERMYLIGVGDDVTLLADVTAEFRIDVADADELAQPSFSEAFADVLAGVRSRYGEGASESTGVNGSPVEDAKSMARKRPW